MEPAGALASQWAAKRPRRFFSRRLVLAVSSVARIPPTQRTADSQGVARTGNQNVFWLAIA